MLVSTYESTQCHNPEEQHGWAHSDTELAHDFLKGKFVSTHDKQFNFNSNIINIVVLTSTLDQNVRLSTTRGPERVNIMQSWVIRSPVFSGNEPSFC
jgi:hypothetical protein